MIEQKLIKWVSGGSTMKILLLPFIIVPLFTGLIVSSFHQIPFSLSQIKWFWYITGFEAYALTTYDYTATIEVTLSFKQLLIWMQNVLYKKKIQSFFFFLGSIQLDCFANPCKPQYGGGIIINPEFNHGQKGWTAFGNKRWNKGGHNFIVARCRNQPHDSVSQKLYLHKDKLYT